MNDVRQRLSRRHFLKIIALGGAVGLAGKLGLDQRRPPTPIGQSRLLMGLLARLSSEE